MITEPKNFLLPTSRIVSLASDDFMRPKSTHSTTPSTLLAIAGTVASLLADGNATITRCPASAHERTSDRNAVSSFSRTCVPSATNMGPPRCVMPVRDSVTASESVKSCGAPSPAGMNASVFQGS